MEMSIHPKIDELSYFLNQNKIDICLYSENWLKPETNHRLFNAELRDLQKGPVLH